MSESDERYTRLLEATRDAATNGYDAIQMRDLAAQTRLSLRTIYQFVSSKDHLIAEAHVDWIGQFRETIQRRRLSGTTPADRVINVFRKFCRSLELNRNLTLTILRALSAAEPSVATSRLALAAIYGEIIDMAIGDDNVADRDTAIQVLGYVFDGVLHQWANDTLDVNGVNDKLERATRLVLGQC